MGLFDDLTVEFELPNGEQGRRFQTKDTPEQYMCRYAITGDRRLRGVGGETFTGEVHFYDYCFSNEIPQREAVDYKALFWKGEMKELYRLNEKEEWLAVELPPLPQPSREGEK